MVTRTATCRCGQLRATCRGEPVRISVCHCLDCQKRTGSAFAVQARWRDTDVTLSGRSATWERTADSGRTATYWFCPECGSTLAYVNEGWTGVTAIPVGAFADTEFPAPRFSVYEHRKHAWVGIGGAHVQHMAEPRPGAPPPRFDD
ncbi:MAG: GFA family protein [Pseudomonadota bacterium]